LEDGLHGILERETIRVGYDTWVRCNKNFRFVDPILVYLYALAIYKIKTCSKFRFGKWLDTLVEVCRGLAFTR
jgi:hypothetical protein